MRYKRTPQEIPYLFLIIITMAAIAVFIQIDRMQQKSKDIRAKAYQQTPTGVRIEAEEMALSGSVSKDPAGTSLLFGPPAEGTGTTTCPPSGSSAGGTAMIDVDLNLSANYHMWVQMKGNGDAANSIWLQLDNLFCAKVGDLTGMPQGSWHWVDFQNGDTGNKIPFPIIGTGHHIVKLIGNGSEPGVTVDRILMVVDATCVPTGNGDACIGIVSTPTPTPTPIPTPTPAPTVTSSASKKPPESTGPKFVTTQLPEGVVGAAYSTGIVASDPTPSDTMSMSVTSLPAGLTLTACQTDSGFGGVTITCTLSGTPTASGNYRPKFTVTDQSGSSASKTFTLRVAR